MNLPVCLTGKGLNWGGSLIRPEATGFGCVYFAEEMLKTRKTSFDGKTVAVSGFGNVAWGAVEKLMNLAEKLLHFPVLMAMFMILME